MCVIHPVKKQVTVIYYKAMAEAKPSILFDDLSKVDLRIGCVIEIADVKTSEKLYVMTVDFGPLGIRTIYAGLRKHIPKRQLKGKKFLFIINLPYRTMPGGESQGMMFVIEQEHDLLLFPAPKGAKEGSGLV